MMITFHKPRSINSETRQRILSAAAEAFADFGFQEATIRDICTRAGANIASISYYFVDKECLYNEVMRAGMVELNENLPIGTGQGNPASPRDRLCLFINSLLRRIEACGRSSYAKLITREMVEPSPALDIVVNEAIRPTSKALELVIRDFLGPAASVRQIRLSCASVVSQCVYYFHCRSMLLRLYPDQTYEPEDYEALASHIIRFSLGGLKAIARAQARTD